jgi:hypothetical protein
MPLKHVESRGVNGLFPTKDAGSSHRVKGRSKFALAVVLPMSQSGKFLSDCVVVSPLHALRPESDSTRQL